MVCRGTLILISERWKPVIVLISWLLFFAGPVLQANAYVVSHTTQTATHPTQESIDASWLEEGKPIEREIAGGQSHSYKFTLTSNQYAHILVQQKGIDVAVTLFGPDGRAVMRIDGSSGLF